MQHLTITIQGFDFNYIHRTIKSIQQILEFFQINNNKIFVLPSIIKKYTLERSPHIDKKSREQFEIKRYKTTIEIQLKNNRTTQIIYYIIKNSIYPGVQLSVSIQFQDFLL
jgi:small subunit ribosomal protein S10